MKSIKNALVRTSLLLCALFVVTFTGCIKPTDPTTLPIGVEYISENDPLCGTWVSTWSETFTITPSTFDTGAYSYAGDNLVVGYTTPTSGYIYVKYTRAYEFSTEDKSSDDTWTETTWPSAGYFRYSSTAPDVGKWYAISFKNLTSNSVSLSGAAGSSVGHLVTSTDTLEEAVEEFTIENGYYAYDYSECVKSE